MWAVAANGLLAGATLDQAVKQLPARHRIGWRRSSAFVAAVAPPLNFSQRDPHGVPELIDVFNAFERLNPAWAALQVIVLVAMVAAALVHLRVVADADNAAR